MAISVCLSKHQRARRVWSLQSQDCSRRVAHLAFPLTIQKWHPVGLFNQIEGVRDGTPNRTRRLHRGRCERWSDTWTRCPRPQGQLKIAHLGDFGLPTIAISEVGSWSGRAAIDW
jgi:hypothetical protein